MAEKKRNEILQLLSGKCDECCSCNGCGGGATTDVVFLATIKVPVFTLMHTYYIEVVVVEEDDAL